MRRELKPSFIFKAQPKFRGITSGVSPASRVSDAEFPAFAPIPYRSLSSLLLLLLFLSPALPLAIPAGNCCRKRGFAEAGRGAVLPRVGFSFPRARGDAIAALPVCWARALSASPCKSNINLVVLRAAARTMSCALLNKAPALCCTSGTSVIADTGSEHNYSSPASTETFPASLPRLGSPVFSISCVLREREQPQAVPGWISEGISSWKGCPEGFGVPVPGGVQGITGCGTQ